MQKARLLNLLGLVSPAANLGMVRVSPKELRYVGLVFGVALWAAAFWGWWQSVTWLIYAALGAHAALVLLGLLNPHWPEGPARAWVGFGKLLGVIFAVPMFTLLYVLVVTPTALLVRLFGKDPLDRGAEPAESYWQDHAPHPRERFERQF